ncbi:lipopolysaccharide transport periplasmic protein LptA [Sulfuritalea hydrogenivorans]|uniref:Lipopolysaccharide export system protein LptA n=1 Tax=Sulfuritalea hydrogenivorans sk43H TaxID=1223802 RepID=W0SJM0_9PROT|nr:lipopolysaccharide transport periplasmic protein LptA [Sulfuritalea hydrogenivorans]MDK9714881.1 lipopolysaccharide transport periplasmic protein LptA [Sulfuritalea sp.]BAO30805.1 lipopolysaccharide transport periplasmic protein LptA [Sulfuritalea hydrogenivorans sk43H]
MNQILRLAAIAGIAGLLLAATAARAEKADRDKPVNIEADRVSVDDVSKVQTFEGNVQLVKGTLIIRAERIVVTQDDDGYQRGVATGTPGTLPRFKQKREGQDDYIEGEGERIVHDAKAEKTEFFNRAWVKSGLDEVRGQFISYDARTENYFVTSGPNGTRAQPGSGERVRATIQPKNKDAGTAAPAAPARPAAAPAPALKGAQNIANPRQETAQ